MRHRFISYFKIMAPVLILVVIGIGCNGKSAEPVIATIATKPPTSVILETASPNSTQSPDAPTPEDTAPVPETTTPEGVLYYDDFTNADSGWPKLEFDNYYLGYHEPEYYHVEVHAPNDKALVPLEGMTFTDFTAEIDSFAEPSITSPDGDFRYGLAFRRAGEQYYAFTISPPTKKWFVLKNSPSGLEVMEEGSDETIQDIGGANRLRVDASGSNFAFHINDHSATTLSDPDYTDGKVGFFVQTFDSPQVHIHYDTLTIREVEEFPIAEGVLYYDDFTHVDSGWPELEFDNYYIGYHEPEYYHVEVHARNDKDLVPLPDMTFSDFTAEIDSFAEPNITSPDGDFRYGLAFRRAGEQYYAFTISPPTKKWFLLKNSPSGLEVLEEGSDETIHGIGDADRLRVDASGSNFAFHINDHSVTTLSDPDYTDGEVGFFVQTFDSPQVHIHYDTLTIREVEAPQLTCSIVVQGLNLRAGPSTEFRILEGLMTGARFEPLGRTSDGLWIRARLEENNRMGWVANDRPYFSCNVPIDTLPVSEP